MADTDYEVTQGSAVPIHVVLRDDQEEVVTTYDGTQQLETNVWPGGDRAALFQATTTWTDPAQGKIDIVLTGDETAGMGPGRYQLLMRLNDGGQWLDAFSATVTVLPGPGADIAPPTYPTDPAEAYELLTMYGRSWLPQLQTDVDESEFILQMGRARETLDEIILSKYRVASMAMVVGNQAFGPRISGAASTWLREQLAANKLVVTGRIGEICARLALSYICEGQIGIGEASAIYSKLARFYRSRAEYLISCTTAEVDTTGTGIATTVIDLSIVNPLYG